jgi:hypothetical protein
MPHFLRVFTEQSSVLLERVRQYQPIMRTWVGPVALIYLTRPEHIEVSISRQMATKSVNFWTSTECP